MPLAFKRVYVDLPPDTDEKLAALAKSEGLSKKALLAVLIENAAVKKTQRKKRSVKRGNTK